MNDRSISGLPPEKGETMGTEEVKVMFVSAPTAEELKPTPQERQHLNDLREWQEKSAESHWVLGEPTVR